MMGAPVTSSRNHKWGPGWVRIGMIDQAVAGTHGEDILDQSGLCWDVNYSPFVDNIDQQPCSGVCMANNHD